MKIIKLTANNVLNLSAVSIDPKGNLTVLTGKNGAGKSAILNAIWYALGGTDGLPSKPIREGAESAKIVVTLGDGEPELVVTRTITPKGPSLTIKDKKGAVQRSPQSILNSLIGKGFIDPLELSRKKPSDQVQTLKNLAGLDFETLDVDRRKAYDERTLVNREVSSLEKRLEAVPFDPEAPKEEIVVSDLTRQLAEAERTNRANESRRHQAAEHALMTQRIQTVLEEDKEKISKLQVFVAEQSQQIETRKKEQAELDAALEKLEDVDTAELRDRIDSAGEQNQRVHRNKHRENLAAEKRKRQTESDVFTKKIEDIDAEKAKRLREAKFPLEGLSIDDAGILFKGLPLSQASTAESLKVWTSVAMALDPKLRVLFIRDGSLLDADSLKAVSEMAAENDFQVWMEDARSTDPAAIVISEGAIVKKEKPEKQKELL